MLVYYYLLLIYTTSYVSSALIDFPNCTIIHNSASAWTVDCSSKNLGYFPKHLLQYPVRNLTFINNNLNSTVKFNIWKNLEHLNVAFNKIHYITNETFNGMDKLIYLNVSFNDIININKNAFESLTILKILDLSGNGNLSTDPQHLQDILYTSFYRGLKKLYISSLDLIVLNDTFFDAAQELSLLDISNNYFTSLPAFPKSLRILDISNNSLTTLPFHSFRYTKNIYTIIAENNKQLNEIQSDAFHGMPELKYVSLKGCTKLDHLFYGTFYSNKNLQYLSLANCNFKTLQSVLKPIILRIDVVDLQENPWNCNVAIKWFVLLDLPTNMTKNLRCALPSDLLLLDFYGPKRHHEILKVVLGTLVVLVFVFFGIGIFFAYEMEKKRKLAHPYTPLGRGAPVASPIYISTVV